MQRLTRDQMAARVARDIPDGACVNLGIGLPTLVANHLPKNREILLQSENGVLGMGPAPAPGEEDFDLINAGKEPVTLLPGGVYFHQADSFGMMRGGHLDICVLGAFQVSVTGDLANWHTGAPDAIPAVGGAMDLAIGAKQVFVMMDHLTKSRAEQDRGALHVSVDRRRLREPDLHRSGCARRDARRVARARDGRRPVLRRAVQADRRTAAARARRGGWREGLRLHRAARRAWCSAPVRSNTSSGKSSCSARRARWCCARRSSAIRPQVVAERLKSRCAGVFDRAVMHVPIETAREAREQARALKADCAVAIGGGSTTGLGKAIALESSLPILAIPTTYAGFGDDADLRPHRRRHEEDRPRSAGAAAER